MPLYFYYFLCVFLKYSVFRAFLFKDFIFLSLFFSLMPLCCCSCSGGSGISHVSNLTFVTLSSCVETGSSLSFYWRRGNVGQLVRATLWATAMNQHISLQTGVQHGKKPPPHCFTLYWYVYLWIYLWVILNYRQQRFSAMKKNLVFRNPVFVVLWLDNSPSIYIYLIIYIWYSTLCPQNVTFQFASFILAHYQPFDSIFI